MAKAKREVVCSKVYKLNVKLYKRYYHSLLSSFFTISTFNIENQNTATRILRHPDAFSCLLSAFLLVHSIKAGIEQKIQQCT